MTTMQAEPGATLEPITRGPISRSQIARFAAATGDFNPIHTDETFAQKVGFPSIIAHGPLALAFLTQALGHNFGAEKVRGVTAQFRAPILPGDTLRIEGTVTEVSGGRANCELRVVRGDDDVVATGTGSAEIG
ncbi:MAG TPA: MaoC family dehydratase [Acidimicrobiia bacterium]|nr:MaoC family dehydratase [Acidimicrobiia bacterium]HKN91310.1 MaoC family dehydratase [Acidimicrobiia bacterium]HMC79400.1 MaoC family dehydratase [Acidimicrobiia bacterium]